MRNALKIAALAASVAFAGGASFAESIKVGNMSSYSSNPQSTAAYRKGWELAVKEINAAGGVGGKTLEVLTRDDTGRPDAGLRAAQELVTMEGVSLLAGTYLSHVAVAVADFAKTNKTFFLVGQPQSDTLIWD